MGFYKGLQFCEKDFCPKYAILEKTPYLTVAVRVADLGTFATLRGQGKSATFARQLWDFCSPTVAL